jgi:hypothetical protein
MMAVSSMRFPQFYQLICVARLPGILQRHYKIKRIVAKVSEGDIEEIDAQFRRLRNAYRKVEDLKMRLEAVQLAHSAVQSVKEC